MKFVAIVLSVIVLALAIVPCCAFDNCADNNQTEQANNKKTNDCETPCSPFVSCTSCPGVCLAPFIELVIVSETVVEKTISVYDQAIVSFYCANIWQPPKITC